MSTRANAKSIEKKTEPLSRHGIPMSVLNKISADLRADAAERHEIYKKLKAKDAFPLPKIK